MVKHGHDMHFLIIVLILAFFVLTLSIPKINPGITGHAVLSEQNSDNLEKFFARIMTPTKSYLTPVNELIKPLVFERSDFSWGEFFSGDDTIGGFARDQLAVVTLNYDCEWVNLENEVFNRIKTMTGDAACESAGHKACMMTNTVKTDSYYSNDCSKLEFKDFYNKFGNCDERIKTISTPCADDFQENGYMTVLCCN